MSVFEEPSWGPYYKQTHLDFRAKVRAFVDAEMIPFVDEWDRAGTYPPELHAKAYEAGACPPHCSHDPATHNRRCLRVDVAFGVWRHSASRLGYVP